MNMYDLIQTKRRGGELTDEQIADLVRGVTDRSIPDYQITAWLMAVCLRGMSERETATLTACMAASGDQIDLSPLGSHTVDKHSTGGVGDKTTLIVAPLAAALGCTVAKMSGRGLGHTGGTIDKLESVPGFCTSLSPDAFFDQVKQIGVAVVGQTGNLAPADKKLYALRDVTATVESVPLIASSVMSKKLAAGAKSIVLDVKVGSGAFMKTKEDGEALAHEMVKIGHNCGRQVRALVTNMDTPLGYAIGNAIEVGEAVEVLRGGGCQDLRRLCVTLVANMLSLSHNLPIEEALSRTEAALDQGLALKKFCEWITAQGGDAETALSYAEHIPAGVQITVNATQDGYISHMDAERIGRAAMLLGAGRMTAEDTIDPFAGIRLAVKTGDYVKAGEPLATFFTADHAKAAEATQEFLSAITLSELPPEKLPLIFSVISVQD
ncbi:MAG: thymidine phosphorylase [Clostridia bacterium]|nr:thymidine phosphorylase [Clostridia bacterium]